ncbi:hypothetical protein CAPTEDRAFT_193233 [Capitella teleta]|uniref:Uncharacterized protein n=1 Tax=Capitella teleta TaxID=283909 RepID=R7UHU6_CAPTE|nr:hypothetical protein CAPTEDRAFT_193233 [Capitella teleta]|eukprot:ELU05785.1 hypothetical protein CAPTEDRAFT_193233 [Capitella teleta]
MAIRQKLLSVQFALRPTLGKWTKSSREIRLEEIVLARARIGHSHLTHGYLLRREMPPVCIPCQSILNRTIPSKEGEQAVTHTRHETALRRINSPETIITLKDKKAAYYKKLFSKTNHKETFQLLKGTTEHPANQFFNTKIRKIHETLQTDENNSPHSHDELAPLSLHSELTHKVKYRRSSKAPQQYNNGGLCVIQSELNMKVLKYLDNIDFALDIRVQMFFKVPTTPLYISITDCSDSSNTASSKNCSWNIFFGPLSKIKSYSSKFLFEIKEVFR